MIRNNWTQFIQASSWRALQQYPGEILINLLQNGKAQWKSDCSAYLSRRQVNIFDFATKGRPHHLESQGGEGWTPSIILVYRKKDLFLHVAVSLTRFDRFPSLLVCIVIRIHEITLFGIRSLFERTANSSTIVRIGSVSACILSAFSLIV